MSSNLSYRNLSWNSSNPPVQKELEKNVKKHCYKVFPTAQGKMGRNGLPIFKNHTSNNAINVYLLYVLEAQKLHTLRG